MSRLSKWPDFSATAPFTRQRGKQLALGLADQGLSVGGMFLVNVLLARTRSKEEYGMFALTYSIFTFLAGLHNAAVLEPFTVYGSGRYQTRFGSYLRLMMRSNVVAGITLSAGLLLTYLLFFWASPTLDLRSLLGLGLAFPFILTGSFLRRSFYVIHQPALAARTSLVFFLTVSLLLGLTLKTQQLNGFSVFLVLAIGWFVAGWDSIRRMPFGKADTRFVDAEPRYWREHWAYSRWVLATAFVFQFMHQGYYWLVAGFLSVKEVGELKAMYVLIAPIEQVIISMSFVFLPVLAARYAAGSLHAFFVFWKGYALLMAAITVTFALTVKAMGSWGIHVLYAGKFDELARMLFFLALVPLVMGLGNTMSDAIRAAEKPRLVFYAYVGSAIATFVLGLPAVRYFGLRGAVYGMLLSAAVYTGTLALAFRLRVHKGTAPAPLDIYPAESPIPTSDAL